jgi:hypothetical protein
LSAHLFTKRAGMEVEPGWPCSGPLLRLAEDVARRLLPGKGMRLRMWQDAFFQVRDGI